MFCILCNSRKPKRSCPAAQGEICPQCCAEQREETLACPLSCDYLFEARKREKLVEVPKSAMPHPEVHLTDEFLNQRDPLVRYIMMGVGVASLATPGATDRDAREAIDSMVQNLKTAGSGLIYETKVVNPLAASIQERLKKQLEKLNAELMKLTLTAHLWAFIAKHRPLIKIF